MNKAFIYKITDGENTYIGSTKNNINRRLSEHFSKYNRYLKGQYRYTSSFKIIEKGRENCKIELLEEFLYNDKKEIFLKERHYILNNKCINIKVPLRTRKEYYQLHKPYFQKKARDYYYNKKKERIAKAENHKPNKN